MVKVKDHDLEAALVTLQKESKPILKEYQHQLHFHPDNRRKGKRPMKQKGDKRPGGRQSYVKRQTFQFTNPPADGKNTKRQGAAG